MDTARVKRPPVVRQALRRVLLALRYRCVRHRVQPFFLLFTQRSGSQLLASYLGCLPGVACLGEILDPHQVSGLPGATRRRAAIVRHVRHSLNIPGVTHAGARIAFNHLAARGLTARLGEEFPAARFIVLYRRRLIDQYVSHALARKTGQWFLRRGAAAPPAVRLRVDRAAFVRYVAEIRDAYREILRDDALRRRASVLAYEELVADPQGMIASRLAPFLGVPSCPVKTYLAKQGTRTPAEVVENFPEVRDLWEDPEFVQHYDAGAAGERSAAR